MTQGKLEVLLVGAKGLEDTDFLNDMDPYVVLSYCGRKQKSSVASGQGSEPEWNESFKFNVTSDSSDLTLRILDSDCGEDDFVGEAVISLEPVLHEGKVATASYNIVKENEFRGEIRVGLSFTSTGGYHGDRGLSQEDNFGGWKQSSSDD